MTPAELRREANNERLISTNQRGMVADLLEWAAGKIERQERMITMLRRRARRAPQRTGAEQ